MEEKIKELERIILFQKKEIEQLQKELQTWKKYLEIAPVILVILDRFGKIEYINHYGARFLGYSKPEDWMEKCLPERVREHIRFIHKKIINGEYEPFEIVENPVLTKFKTEKIVQWRNTHIKDRDGNIISTLSIGKDVTAEKKIEKREEEIEHQYKLIFDSLPEPIYVINKNFRIEILNKAFRELLILLNLNTEVIGKTVFEAFPFLDQEKVKQEYENVFKTGETLITTEVTNVGEKEIKTETRKIPVFYQGDVFQIITAIKVLEGI